MSCPPSPPSYLQSAVSHCAYPPKKCDRRWQQGYSAYPRRHFAHTALCTAIASGMVGLGAAPAMASEADPLVNSRQASLVKGTKTGGASADRSQLDTALDALRLKQAVDQGIIEPSVLEEYSAQNFGSGSKEKGKQEKNAKRASTNPAENPSQSTLKSFTDNLHQQALNVQQQGYQMLTPAQIEQELAAVNNATRQRRNGQGDNGSNNNNAFNAPTATINGSAPPIGFDVTLDAANLPAPTNLETLASNKSDTAEIMARPVSVSDAVSSRPVDSSRDILQQPDALQALAEQNRKPTREQPTVPDKALNPEDYLPSYQPATGTQVVVGSMVEASKPKPRARSKGSFIKRAYNRLFNGGYKALPHVETTVYLQQSVPNAAPILIKADSSVQPINNIQAALDDTTVQSVQDFTAALPRLRQIAMDAAKAVGYYDITLRLRQPNSDSIDVIIEKLGEPVCVDSRVIDIRGKGSEQAEFIALREKLEKINTADTCQPDKKGEVFNHGIYKDSKAALESLSRTYGYFDQYWLNKSVEIILPDNIADISLVYNTGERYQFDDVVFFTYDKASKTLTTDPDKLPVEPSLLRQLYDFNAGDPFYRPDITKFTNDLSATRYFNTVNVETILPPDGLSATTTLAFDNAPIEAASRSRDDNDGADNASTTSNGDDAAISSATDNDLEGAPQVKDSRAVSNAENDEGANSTTGADTVNAADIAPIEFEVDEETSEKLAAIKKKADRLSRLPSDRVLDEKSADADSILGKISDSVSSVAKKLFPDDELLIADENFVPPTLEGRISPEQVQQTKKVPLYVFVSADKPRDAQLGIGYGTDTGVRATGKIDYNLINRKGYQAGAEVALSRINKNGTVYASRPWKHPLNDKLEARLTYEEETIDQGEGNFDLSTKTLKAALARNIHRENGWDSSYFMRYRLDQLETGVDAAAFEDLPVRFASSKPKQQALLFGYGVSKTTADSATNPTRGYRQYYGIEAGADKAFSDTNLAIIRAGVSGIYTFGEDKKHQVLGSVNTGYIWADDFYNVPYKLRFFAGGDQSIRGYDYNSLSPIDKGYLSGGQILAVGSAEYNYEVKPGLRAAVFSDVGNAYDKDFKTDTKVGVGVGVRWASPVGVVRVDVAAGVTEDEIPVRLHLFIGSPL
ncbi:BamA/TamA family outer membrane protein [Psychrobacter sp. 16-MNA-CIBAN-0192]|uniref:autotransporter assembly complex protein TamA n=1 Tax=Psychrobacter sp. 16-MNA-CIBAN-0192 TaxID=3140448 RepID=UPI00331E269B